jgi:O-antigen/teichoic acid export membrane protein
VSSFQKNLKINSFSKFSRNVVLSLQGFLLTPIVIQFLGLEGASVWFLITQFMAYVQLSDLGITTGLIRISSSYLSTNNENSSRKVLTVSLFLLLIIALLITISAEYFLCIFFSIFDLSDNSGDIQFAFIFALIVSAINLPLRCGISILESHQKFFIHLRIETIFIVLRVCVLYFFSYLNLLDLISLSIIYFGTNLFIHAIQFFCAIKLSPIYNLKDTFRNTTPQLKQIFTIGLSVMIVTASATTLRQGTPILVGLVNGIDKSVTLFTITMLLVFSIMQLLTLPVSFVGPEATRLHSQKKYTELYSIFILFSKYSLLFATFVSISFATFGKAFLSFWLDVDKNEIHTIYQLTFFIVSFFSFSIPSLYARMILSFVNKHIITSILELLIVITGLIFGYINIVKFNLGLFGIAFGIVTIFILRTFGPLMVVSVRYFKINIKKYLTDLYLKYTFLMIAALSVYLILLFFVSNENIVHALTLSLFTILAWSYMLENVHKDEIKHFFAKYLNQ